MRWMLWFLLFSLFITAADPEASERPQTRPHSEIIDRLFHYLFCTTPPHGVGNILERKLGESSPDIRAAVERISSTSSSESDAPDEVQLKAVIFEAIHEAMEEQRLEVVDTQLQLEMKEKEVRQARYKFLAGATGTVTGFLGVIGTIVAYQSSGC